RCLLAGKLRSSPGSRSAEQRLRHCLPGDLQKDGRNEAVLETIPTGKAALSRANWTYMRTAFGIGAVCKGLPKRFAECIFIEGRHRRDSKQPQDESAFHVVFGCSKDGVPSGFSSRNGDCTGAAQGRASTPSDGTQFTQGRCRPR